MSEGVLFTAKVFEVTARGEDSTNANSVNNDNQLELFSGYRLLKSYPNMVSARVIKGKIIELEHSDLVGLLVKFKTVINYTNSLAPESSLGVMLTPQESYIAKLDHEGTAEAI